MSPKTRQAFYSLGTVASGLLTLLVTFHILDPSTASGLGNVVAALVGLLGTAASGTAAVVVGKQRKEGTLDFTGSAAEQAVSAIQTTVSQAATASAELQKVQAAASQLAQVAAGSLVAQVINSVK